MLAESFHMGQGQLDFASDLRARRQNLLRRTVMSNVGYSLCSRFFFGSPFSSSTSITAPVLASMWTSITLF